MRLAAEQLEDRRLLAVLFAHDADDTVRAISPSESAYNNFGLDWIGGSEPFDDSAWQTTSGAANGVGYDRGNAYDTLLGLDLESSMHGARSTLFARAEFNVADPSAVDRLTLSLRYDDGFIAWINGVEIARTNADSVYPAWSATATAEHQASTTAFETFDLAAAIASLQTGTNILAIRGLNLSATDDDALIQFTLVGESRTGPPLAVNDTATTEENVPVTIDVLANDQEGSGAINPASVVIASPPVHGTAVANSDGTVTYTPNAVYNGPDTFTYTVRDGVGVGQPTQQVLISDTAPARAFIPSNNLIGTTWRGGNEPFNDNGWLTGTFGVGFDTFPQYLPYIGLDVLPMHNVAASVYIRSTFTISNPADVAALELQMRYDDGFTAFINGVQVASDNAPSPLTNTSAALQDRPDDHTFRPFNISAFTSALRPGQNVLAIHGLNVSASSSDLILQPRLIATIEPTGQVSNPATVTVQVTGVDYPPIATNDNYDVEEGQTLIVAEHAPSGGGVTLGPGQFLWDTAAGGNGHVYERIVQSGTWSQARTAAAARSLGDTPGHLATITSAAELAFLQTVFPSENAWIGGYQDTNAPDYSEPSGGWRWVTGEPWGFTNWKSGEPNNAGEEQLSSEGFGWNDINASHNWPAYWVEYAVTDEVLLTKQLIAAGATWRYRDNGQLPPNDTQNRAWKDRQYSDAGWSSGPAEFGYGDNDEDTVINCGPNAPTCNSANFITTWFRRSFTLAPGEARRAASVSLELLADDGASVYVNGVEVARTNLPGTLGDSAITPSTLALIGLEPSWLPFNIDLSDPRYASLLRDGDNVVAVEVHQATATSSDVSFDFRLAVTLRESTSVLDNDVEPDGQALTAVLETPPQNGTLDFRPNGTFTYTPNAAFVGIDTFTYRASDGLLTSEPATVTITVAHAAPTATPDSYTTDESTQLVVVAAAGVLSNDIDTQGHALTASVVTLPAHGSLTLNPNGSFTYTPTSGYHGTDTFTYVASDGQRNSAPATVTITLRSINTPPTAVNDTFTVNDGATFGLSRTGIVKMLGTGFNDPTGAKLVNAAGDTDYLVRSGSVTAAGIPAYVARSGGPSAWLSDGASNNSAWISVGLGDRAVGSYFYDTTVFVPGGDASSVRLANLRYAADNKLVSIFVNSIEVFTQPIGDAAEHSDFRSLGNLGTGAFLPGANTIRFEVYNSGGPTAFRVEGVVEFDPAAAPSVLANDSDVDSPTFNARSIDLPTNGTLQFDANGKFRYTPNPGFVGVDTFTYVANDGESDSNVATVTMNVLHGGPTVVSDAYLADEDATLEVNPAQGVLANDSDSQGHELTAVLDQAPAHGSLDLRADGSFTYTPAANYFGTDSFQYRASDGTLTSLPVTVQLTVSAVADAPLAADDRYQVLENQTLVVGGNWGQPVVLLPGMFQWSTAQGGNGHVYQRISGARNWHDARRDAESRMLGPTAGHLVTITSGSERSFLAALGENEHWLGGFQDTQSPLYVEPAGGWKWITGEPWAYTSWQGGEPNNAGEEHLSGGGGHNWNDLPGAVTLNDYWVEFPVNEPIRYDALVPQGATWRYRDDGANLGTAWRLPQYIDSSWASGPAQLGYGEGDEATVTFGGATGARFATTYFRHDFNVAQIDHIKALTLDVLRDDGIAVYLNGTQILRNNLAANAAFNQFASGAAPDDGQTWQPFAGIDPALLRSGENTIAVEVHASGASDTDLSFDLRLTAMRDYNPPLLANDTDVDGVPPRIATLGAGPPNGVLTLLGDGGFSYRPNDGFFGVDMFTYRASDGSLLSEPATVTIHVIHPAPTAGNDIYATNEDTPLNVSAALGLLANDVDTQGHPLSITIARPPAHGVLTVQTDGSFSYIPTNNFHGTDSFTYFVSDGEQASELATVTITIASVNDIPQAGDDEFTIDRGTTLLFSTPSTTVETIGQTSFAEPPTGTLSSLGDEEMGFITQSQTYTELGVTDSDQYILRGVAGTFRLLFDELLITEYRQVAVRFDLRAFEDSAGSDFEEADFFRAQLAFEPRGGGQIVMQTIADLNGVELKAIDTGAAGSFTTYSANALEGYATVRLIIEASVDSNTERLFLDNIVFEGVAAKGGNLLLEDDTDADGDELTVRIVSQPSHGTLETNEDGAMVYRPAPLFVGEDAFTYVANDGTSDSNIATVTIHVLLANLVPTAANDSYSINEDEKLIVSVANGLLANDTDLDGDSLTIRVVEGPAHGSLSTLPNGAFHYTPAANYAGPDSFKYVASDGRDDSAAATVSIAVAAVNDAPTTNRDVYSIGTDETLDASAAATQAYRDLVMASNPMGYWRFGESNTSQPARDEIANRHGQYVGGVTVGQPGAIGDGNSAARFDATSGYVNVPNSSAFNLANNFSVEGWIKPNTLGQFRRIAGLHQSGTGWGFGIHDTRLVFTTAGILDYFSPANSIKIGEWHHIVAVFDASNDVSFYVNGNLIGQVAGSQPARSSIANLHIGSEPDGYTDSYVDDIAIYSRVLTPAEIAEHYAAAMPTVADSVAEFSGTQGQDGWFYGYYNRTTDGDGVYQPANFTQFPRGAGAWSATNYWDAASNRWKWFNGSPPWTEILPSLVHPNGTNSGQEHWVVRRWVSDFTGPVVISGHLAKDNAGGGDGVRGLVYVNGTIVYDRVIGGADSTGVEFEVNATLASGAIVDFVLTPNGGDFADGTRFTSQIRSGSVSTTTEEVLARNSVWKYRDGIVNGSAYPSDAQGNRWIESDYDDAAWSSGPGILGFGGIDAGPIRTTIRIGPDGGGISRTALFRRTFEIENPDRIALLTLESLIDDGAAIYINGREVVRYNLPGTLGDGTLRTDSLAPTALNEASYNVFNLDLAAFPGLLMAGTNTIAVEVHQINDTSSDLGFDLSIAAKVLPDPVASGVLGNDTDAEGDPMSAIVVAGPYHGVLDFDPDGTFTYTPSAGFEGVDQFTYRASDGMAESAATLVTINVGNANRPPLAADDRYVARSGVPLAVAADAGLFKNDFDANGDPLTAAVFTQPNRGTLALAGDGSFVYTPQGNFLGVDTFTYRVADGNGTFGFATAAIQVVSHIDPINGVPIAAADSFAATAGAVLNVSAPGLLANDRDPELRPLVAVVEQSPWHGSLSFVADGSFTYTPSAGFTGEDAFTYRVTDGNTFSAPATVVLNVAAAIPAGGVSPPLPPSSTPTGSTQLPGPHDSTSLRGTLPASGDLNGDGRVDRADLAIVIAAYGSTSASPGYSALADLSGDGRVSIADAIVLRNRMSNPLQPASSSALVRRASDRLSSAASQLDAIAATTLRLRATADLQSSDAAGSPLRAARLNQPRPAIARPANKMPTAAVDKVLASDAGMPTALAARRTGAREPRSS